MGDSYVTTFDGPSRLAVGRRKTGWKHGRSTKSSRRFTELGDDASEELATNKQQRCRVAQAASHREKDLRNDSWGDGARAHSEQGEVLHETGLFEARRVPELCQRNAVDSGNVSRTACRQNAVTTDTVPPTLSASKSSGLESRPGAACENVATIGNSNVASRWARFLSS